MSRVRQCFDARGGPWIRTINYSLSSLQVMSERSRTLVGRYEAPLRKLVYGLVRDWALAEDVAQDAFLRVYQKASTFRGGSPFKAWLYRIAINRAHDELRRIRRKGEISLESAAIGRLELDEGRTSSAEALASARELERHVARALSEMRQEYRTALMLREMEGLTYREIAELLEWPLGNGPDPRAPGPVGAQVSARTVVGTSRGY